MDSPNVDIIIPAYNASPFLKECIDSIFSQVFINWKIILVNDGSTDNTPEIAREYRSEKITVINQPNQGVSSARNNGFINSNSKYVLFLDADDLLTPDFLEFRVNFLEKNTEYSYCCGDMIKFSGDPSKHISYHQGCFNDPVKEILLYSSKHDTAPSNYLFRREIIAKNKLLFNRLISSTADRLFLLELSTFSKGGYVSGAPFLYRVHEKSMSNKLTDTLINDNIKFYKIITMNKFIPKQIKRKAMFFMYSILGFSYLKINNIKGFSYIASGFIKYPDLFIKKFSLKVIKSKKSI